MAGKGAVGPPGFRVIIAGGGPTGLLTAHMLSKAGIDFVLLEKRPTCKAEAGASIFIGPSNVRIFDQLGLLPELKRLYHPLSAKQTVLAHDGTPYYATFLMDWFRTNYGRTAMLMNRRDLLDMLYEGLPEADKARVLTNKGVADVETRKDGVTVICEDGSKIEGSMLIGAEGVHSPVRGAMRRLALKESPTAVVNDEKPFLTTYRCLFGLSPLVPGFEPAETWSCHGHGASSMVFVGKDVGFFLVYEQLDKPTRERHRYTQEEKEDFVQRLGHIPLTSNCNFKEMYSIARETTLVDLQEGFLKVFSHDRICVVGDALCKHTPNAGHGFNSAIQDVTVLVSNLYRMLEKHPKEQPVETESIRTVMTGYQKEREPHLRDVWQATYIVTRLQAGYNCLYWALERWIVPALDLSTAVFTIALGRVTREGRVLPYLPETQLLHGKVPWVHYPDGAVKPARKNEFSWAGVINWGRLAIGLLFILFPLLLASMGRNESAVPGSCQDQIVMGLPGPAKGSAAAH